MDVKFNFDDAFSSIENELRSMSKELTIEKGPIVRKCAQVIKKNVEANLPKSDISATATNYDGTPYVHMKNEVKATIKDDKAGNVYAIIGGGKHTAHKWHMVDNGTSRTAALHFTDKAMKQSDSEIDAIADELIRKVVSNGG